MQYPPTEKEPTAAEAVRAFGLAIFGPDWAAGLSRLAAVDPPTVGRIEAVAAQGRDDPAAGAVLAALSQALDALAAKARPFSPFGAALDPNPVMEPRPVRFFSEWYVQVAWSDGHKQRVDGFESEAHARGWIATEAQAWIAHAKRSRR